MKVNSFQFISLFSLYIFCTSSQAAHSIESVAQSRWQWTGLAVTDNHQIFVNFPRWSTTPISVAQINKQGQALPWPNATWNQWQPEQQLIKQQFVAVQSIVRDRKNHIWVLDTGNPFFKGVIPEATRLFKFSIQGKLLWKHTFSEQILPKNAYLNDVRFDEKQGFAFLTDSGSGGLVVVNLSTHAERRVLAQHPSTLAEEVQLRFDGEVFLWGGEPPKIHSDGIAYDATHDRLYYMALTSRTLYSIPAQLLRDFSTTESQLAQAVTVAANIEPMDGLLSDHQGRIYLSNLQQNRIDRLVKGKVQPFVTDARIRWPDSFSFTQDKWLYFTTAQIHLGADPQTPYEIFRVRVAD